MESCSEYQGAAAQTWDLLGNLHLCPCGNIDPRVTHWQLYLHTGKLVATSQYCY